MDVKYIVIDLSKIDGDKLSEMLEKAYKDGYQKGRECIGSITAPTIPYNGDAWQTVTGYTTSTNAINTIGVNGTELDSCTIAVGSGLESHTITLASDVAVAKAP